MGSWYYFTGSAPGSGLLHPTNQAETPSKHCLETVVVQEPRSADAHDGHDGAHQPTAPTRKAVAPGQEARPSQNPALPLESLVVQSSVLPVSRPASKPSKALRQIRDLNREMKAATGSATRTAITQKINTLKNSFTYNNGQVLGRVYDLEGNQVGRIHTRETSPYDFVLGDRRYVRGFRFVFIRGTPDFGERRPELYIRTTAYLTDEGKKEAQQYITRYRNSSLHDILRRYGGSYQRRMDGNGKTFDIPVRGHEAHINLNGKIDIFTPYPIEMAPLSNKCPSEQARCRFVQYTHYTRVKAWIGKTDAHTNGIVALTFKNLASVLDGIFEHTAKQSAYERPPLHT